jgi:hypothetical protein
MNNFNINIAMAPPTIDLPAWITLILTLLVGGAIAMLILKLFMQVSLYLEGP